MARIITNVNRSAQVRGPRVVRTETPQQEVRSLLASHLWNPNIRVEYVERGAPRKIVH